MPDDRPDLGATATGTTTTALRLRGVHHLALNTDDMKKTLDFYIGVLGMRLVHGLTTPPGGEERSKERGSPPYGNVRHYFFDMGGDSLLAFFEMPKDSPKGNRNALATMQHVSFTVDYGSFEPLLQRLKDQGVKIIFGPILSVPPSTWSFYFFDPNGIRLEVSANEDQGDGSPEVVGSVTQTDDELRAELLALSDDPDWIERMIASKNG